MTTPFGARPNQEPEVFPLTSMHHHPVYEGFWVLRNGDIWVSVGSQVGPIGNFNLSTLPPETWIPLQDNQGSPLPVEIYIQRFGNVFARWLSTDEKPPT